MCFLGNEQLANSAEGNTVWCFMLRMGARQFSLLFLTGLLTSWYPWVSPKGPQFLLLSIGVGASGLAHWGVLWVGKQHWKFETQLTITYYCLFVLPKKAAEHDKDSWLIMLPASLLVKRDPRINIWKRVLLSLLGTLTFSWFLLFLPAPASGLILRTQREGEAWETGRLTSKNPLPRVRDPLRRSPAWLHWQRQHRQAYTWHTGMPMANDFLTWPRSFKEQRKKIPQDAAVQRVTYSSSQTKYEAEDTLKNEYNLFKQQTNIPVVWRRNSKGNHPTKKEYLMSPPRNWLRLLRAELSILQSPAPMLPRAFCSLVHILLFSKEEWLL